MSDATTDGATSTTSIVALLIEDDERLARLTARFLELHHVRVIWVPDGAEGLTEAGRLRPDVVLLDLQLPTLDGLSICRALRERSNVPIIMVTARDAEADRVLGLDLGADDYLTKPFSSHELLARIRANVRRARGQAGPRIERINLGRLLLEPGGMEAFLDGRALALTGYEFALLRALAENAGRVLSREQLMLHVRGNAEEAFDRSIDVQISRLRQKLGDDPKQPQLLKTVRGAGYMLARASS